MKANGLRTGFMVFTVLAASVFGTLNLAADATVQSNSSPAVVAAPALKALPAAQHGTAQTLVKVYSQPGANSAVINVLPPASQVTILGLDENAGYYAVAGREGLLSGWVSRQDVAVEVLNSQTTTLVKVYRQAGASEEVVDILPPATRITLLGQSVEGGFYGISSAGSYGRLDGYVRMDEVEAAHATGRTTTLGKVYRSTRGEDAELVTVLPPHHALRITGRSASGNWTAVSSDEAGLSGWIRTSEIETNTNADSLPVFSKE